MVNILLEGFDIAAPWLFDELKHYLKPHHKVAVLALSFRDNTASASDWDALYGRSRGRFYKGIVGGLTSYGIAEDSISFINYFTDTEVSAKKKIKDADILYFPGGLPDRMMERIEYLRLTDALAKHSGIAMGYSAGALIQLAEYHLSEDDDYPEFKYCRGLPYLENIYLEVHYTGTDVQNAAIERVLKERGGRFFATSLMSGAIIVENGNVKLIGNVKEYI